MPCARSDPRRRTLALVPRRPVVPVPSGTLCVIGGAEDRVGERIVLRKFVELAGGDGSRIAVVATASSLGPEILETYDEVFRSVGAAGTTNWNSSTTRPAPGAPRSPPVKPRQSPK